MVVYLLVASFVVYCVGLVVYRLFLSPIRHIPGPKLAAATWWYEAYFDWWKHGQFYKEIERLHSVYGPVVRINPVEVHVKDRDWYNELYTSSSRPRDKPTWFLGAASRHSIISTGPHHLHRVRRAPLNRFFSAKAVADLNSVLQDRVDDLCKRFKEMIGKEPVAMQPACFALTFDIICDYALGKSEGLLESPDFGMKLNNQFFEVAELGILTRHFGFILMPMKFLPDWVLERIMPTSVVDFSRSLKTKKKEIEEFLVRKRDGKEEVEKEGDYRTVFDAVLASDLPMQEKTPDRLADEAYVILGAGAHTTAQTIAITTFHLLNTPRVLRKLQEELDAAMPDSEKILPWQALEQLPYCRATILEGHRITAAITGRAQRIAPTEDLRYKDVVIPAGTEISMSTHFEHLNPEIFPSPLEFRPERFLEDVNAERYVMPFTKGSRICLGINLAAAELALGIASIFRRFDMELYDTEYERDIKFSWDNVVGGAKPESKGVRVKILKERK